MVVHTCGGCKAPEMAEEVNHQQQRNAQLRKALHQILHAVERREHLGEIAGLANGSLIEDKVREEQFRSGKR